MTIGKVADHLKVTERTIYRLPVAQQIRAFEASGGWRFTRGEIEAWIRNHNSRKKAKLR